eukprot:g585.t1
MAALVALVAALQPFGGLIYSAHAAKPPEGTPHQSGEVKVGHPHLVLTASNAGWVHEAFPAAARDGFFVTQSAHHECTVAAAHDIPASSQRQVLIASTTNSGNFARDIGESFRDMLKRVRENRKESGIFIRAPDKKGGSAASPPGDKNCLIYIGADESDSYYHAAVSWASTTADAFGFEYLREIRFGKSDADYARMLTANHFRAALYDCPAVEFGGGNPAKFARNILYAKKTYPAVWREFQTLVERGLLLVFAYSAGASIAGRHAFAAISGPDGESAAFLREQKSLLDVVEWVHYGTLDVLGNVSVKPHFGHEGWRKPSQEKFLNWLRAIALPEPEENPLQVIALSDGPGEMGQPGMDYVKVGGNRITACTSNSFEYARNKNGVDWPNSKGFFNVQDRKKDAKVIVQVQYGEGREKLPSRARTIFPEVEKAG